MEALLVLPVSDKSMEEKWSKMVVLSLILHLAVFSTILFVPEPEGTRNIRDVVYEVDLVEMPRGKQPRMGSTGVKNKGKSLAIPPKASETATKRIGQTKSKKPPVVIAKRTVKVEAKKIEQPEVSSSKLLDQALSRIEQRIKEQEKAAADQRDAEPEGRAEQGAGAGPVGSRVTDGIVMGIYKEEIKDWVCSNWSYPVALLGPNSAKNLLTIVVLRVERSGTIIRTTVIRSSGNEGFDQSVLKAIKRSDPLPSFPEGYRKTHEEIEIKFDLSDLKNL